MVYLDTHVVVWLYAGLTERLSRQARTLINEQDLLISPTGRLELHYLYESDRVTVDSAAHRFAAVFYGEPRTTIDIDIFAHFIR